MRAVVLARTLSAHDREQRRGEIHFAAMHCAAAFHGKLLISLFF
jgi:hypothetical protein